MSEPSKIHGAKDVAVGKVKETIGKVFGATETQETVGSSRFFFRLTPNKGILLQTGKNASGTRPY
jgi:hypothetical protein